jgi:hypothetical protein
MHGNLTKMSMILARMSMMLAGGWRALMTFGSVGAGAS